MPGTSPIRWIPVFIGLIALSSALSNFMVPLWLSWMGDLIPKRILNRYWGSRLEYMTLVWAAAFFGIATKGLIRRPNLARALLRAAACGEPELAKQVAAFHDRMEGMVVAALRGGREASGDVRLSDECERSLAHTLTLVWFALLVGWSGGLHGQAAVIEQMSASIEWMLLGAQTKQIV